MKYYLIAGEASGDLHASKLMEALKQEDPEAQFRFFGGEMMQSVGGTLVKHYRELAFMGFVPVLLHLRTIFANMSRCKRDIVQWQPDVVILVDYPGFNLNIARFVHAHTCIPVYYYISPKIWAWKEYRIKNIRRDVTALFSILPFEVEFYEHKHGYPIHYVGNPTVDEVHSFLQSHPYDRASFLAQNGLPDKPLLALLAGSRRQEIKDNLPLMLQAARSFPTHQPVLACAPGIDPEFYAGFVKDSSVKLLFNRTYELLQYADAAVVTSGTATLETALFNVPQVVCYYTPVGKFISFLRRHLLKVPYISLVNLIVRREVVRELVADGLSLDTLRNELHGVISNQQVRQTMRNGYAEMARRLGEPGAPLHAARIMVQLLRANTPEKN